MTNTPSFLTQESAHKQHSTGLGSITKGNLVVKDADGLDLSKVKILSSSPGGEFKITAIKLVPGTTDTAQIEWEYKHTDAYFSGLSNTLIQVVDAKGISSTHYAHVNVPYAPPVNTPSQAIGGDKGKGTLGSLITGDLDVKDAEGITNPNFQIFSKTGTGDFKIDAITGKWEYTSFTSGVEVIHVKVTDNLGAVSTVGVTVNTLPLVFDPPSYVG